MNTFELESSADANSNDVDHQMPADDRETSDIAPYTIWVGGIPDRCSSRPDTRDPTRGTPVLKREFAKFGEVVSMSVRRGKNGELKTWALITFVDSSSVAAALKSDITVRGDDGAAALLITREVSGDDLGSPKARAGALATLADKQQKLLIRHKTMSNDRNSSDAEPEDEDVFEKESATGDVPPPKSGLCGCFGWFAPKNTRVAATNADELSKDGDADPDGFDNPLSRGQSSGNTASAQSSTGAENGGGGLLANSDRQKSTDLETIGDEA
jgi:hypothetical protein